MFYRACFLLVIILRVPYVSLSVTLVFLFTYFYYVGNDVDVRVNQKYLLLYNSDSSSIASSNSWRRLHLLTISEYHIVWFSENICLLFLIWSKAMWTLILNSSVDSNLFSVVLSAVFCMILVPGKQNRRESTLPLLQFLFVCINFTISNVGWEKLINVTVREQMSSLTNGWRNMSL